MSLFFFSSYRVFRKSIFTGCGALSPDDSRSATAGEQDPGRAICQDESTSAKIGGVSSNGKQIRSAKDTKKPLWKWRIVRRCNVHRSGVEGNGVT